MDSKIKLLFIVNPISGIGKQKKFEQIVSENIDSERFAWQIEYTEYAGHAVELTAKAVAEKFDVVTAVGGDGSVNEVAAVLAKTETALAIIPCGSGNGLARTLGIPTNPEDAILKMNVAQFKKIDTATVNGKFFISLAGVGFDSTVAKKYEEIPGRGFHTYFKAMLPEYFKYTPHNYIITADGKTFMRNALLITAFNSTQYGFGFKIVPNAKLDDGLLDLCIITKPPLKDIPWILSAIVAGHSDLSRYIEIIPCQKVSIKGNDSGYINLDGETIASSNEFVVETTPKGIVIFV